MKVSLSSAWKTISRSFNRKKPLRAEFEIFQNIDGSDALLIPKNPNHNTVRLQFMPIETIERLSAMAEKIQNKKPIIADTLKPKVAGLLSLDA